MEYLCLNNYYSSFTRLIHWKRIVYSKIQICVFGEVGYVTSVLTNQTRKATAEWFGKYMGKAVWHLSVISNN